MSSDSPRVITEDLGGSPLARAARAGTAPHGWYRPRPAGADAWREHAREVAASIGRGWLERLRPAMEPEGPALARLERVARAGGVVVTTGQQPGLFGGPVLTFAKAITARALADTIERETGIPTAPVFWAATDDSDFAEASWTKLAVQGGAVALRIDSTAPEGVSMSRVPLGDVSVLLDQLADACGSMVDARPLEIARRAYRPEGTVGSAYLELLRELLHPLEIAVLDASSPATRRAAEPVLRGALARGREVEQALADRVAAIERGGFTAQVEAVKGLSLVFTSEDGTRRRLPVGEGTDRAREIPAEALSPNVLLRPVVERSILPTVAYVGGPGEIAYFAEIVPIAQTLGVAAPLIVPRWSCTILEPRVERMLARLGVEAKELASPDAVETRLARAAVPAELRAGLEHLRNETARGLAVLAANDTVELMPRAALEGLGRRVGHQIDRLERRYAAAVKRRETQLMLDVATARGALYPDGVRQERALSYVPFLARYGESLVRAMLAEATRHAEGLVAGAPVLPPSRAAEPSPA